MQFYIILDLTSRINFLKKSFKKDKKKFSLFFSKKKASNFRPDRKNIYIFFFFVKAKKILYKNTDGIRSIFLKSLNPTNNWKQKREKHILLRLVHFFSFTFFCVGFCVGTQLYMCKYIQYSNKVKPKQLAIITIINLVKQKNINKTNKNVFRRIKLFLFTNPTWVLGKFYGSYILLTYSFELIQYRAGLVSFFRL